MPFAQNENNASAEAVPATATSIAAKIDRLGKMRELKTKINNRLKRLEEAEKALREEIGAVMLASGVTVLGGTKFRASAKADQNYNVTDWPALYDYIHENRAFELLHRRLGVTAAAEHMEPDPETGEAHPLPGVEVVEVTKLVLTRLRSR